jgi:dihydroorotate dehydrogenase subfamily 1
LPIRRFTIILGGLLRRIFKPRKFITISPISSTSLVRIWLKEEARITLKPDLSVEIVGVKLRTPIIQASGGPYTKDGKSIAESGLAGAAAVTTKSIHLKGAKVCRPCMIRTPVGVINCEEWSDVDYEDWIGKEIAEAKKGGVPVIANLSDETYDFDNLGRMCRGAVDAGADILEVAGGYDSSNLPKIIRVVKKEIKDVPVIGKISPPINDIAALGRAVVKAGADAISSMDTIGPCYLVDIETGKMILGKGTGAGRLSGPAIKPFVLYYVMNLARAIDVPIIGIGGVHTGNDVVEMIMGGATAVGICTATLLKGLGVYKEMEDQLTRYMERKKINNLSEIRGIALKDIEKREKERYMMYEARTPVIHAEKCTGCMICIKVCGYKAIKVQDKAPKADVAKCYGCGLCISSCPTAALTTPY